MRITIEVSDDCESTSSPWWMIVDPKQMMSPRPELVAMGMITGPFFSREEAESELKSRRYAYGKRAVVWCHSGCYSRQYDQAYRKASKKSRRSNP